MPFVTSARELLSVRLPGPSLHEEASGSIVSLSWAFLVIPCLFLVVAFGWILYSFSQPSEFPQANGFGHADHDADDTEGDDEKEQLLDGFRESQSHVLSSDAASSSGWKINGKFSTTSRGGSVYTSYSSPNSSPAASSPKSKRVSLAADGKPSRSVGSKAAKVLAYNRDRMMRDLENVDPVDREELQRSSSRASETRKSD
ncbi:hypothetical protein PSEUBRA_006147 [Kalmanozyma brasiliensis GHG001]|uniref:uncharacterized protein n=1 Tax=Kalmanozyma brasiliensis (strain GHG001) TaxID=1365824 RepID=UPI001CE85B74|nr:uncharacterized protein PSEUBRA_006147 [Kalmanozyma brasiliensis GHG001]KAF6767628.1 hypothetical protein PSEUBRA_006147 [Kalmanozyma brasiliensis GHG001]